MLRAALLVVALVLLAVGLGTTLGGVAGTFPMALWGAVLLLAVLFERWRYRARAAAGEGPWEETTERYIDPETGMAMRVLYNPRTGERRYQPAPAEAARSDPPTGA